tara:strand:- start:3935 stop:4576 length:642 start_codon:yes stop_codon:yes gene_type:complete
MSNNDINNMEKSDNEMKETSTNESDIRTSKEIFAEKEKLQTEITLASRRMKALDKELEKTVKFEIKEASKRKKTKSSTDKRGPSGFNAKQSVPIEFTKQPWGADPDAELPRTTLTKMVYDYVKEHKLQDPEDKRRIFPDDNLKELFHLNEGDELHFNNFQTYMKRLYDRSFPEESAAEESEMSEPEDNKKNAESSDSKKKKKKKNASKSSKTV